MLGEDGDIHFAAVSRTGGYAGALARVLDSKEKDDTDLAKALEQTLNSTGMDDADLARNLKASFKAADSESY